MRLKIKRKTFINKSKFLILSLILAIITSFILVSKIGEQIKPSLIRYATVEAQRFSNIIVNHAVDEIVQNNLDNDKIFTIVKNKNDEIETIDFNTKNVNKILELITKNIQEKLFAVETGNIEKLKINDGLKGINIENLKKGVVCEIPAGSLYGASLLANTGPIIPVKLSFIGKVNTTITTNIKEYGINNVYLEVNVRVEVMERITMPIFTEEVKSENDIPIAIKVIQGKIPNYYSNGLETNSNSYTLPNI